MDINWEALAANILAAPWVPSRASLGYADNLATGGIAGSDDE